MKVTTVRFGADLWRLLEAEARQAGVSVSQYIREAALARASAAAAARGEDPLELLGGPQPPRARGSTRDTAAERISEAEALAAEAKQALRHAQAVSAQSRHVIGRSDERRAAPR